MTTNTTITGSNAIGVDTGFRSRFAVGFITLVALLIASTLQAQDFDRMGEAIARGSYGNLKAVIISRHGEIIYEDYFRGSQPDDLHQVQSVTKSVGSALLGVAHRQGKIQLDQDMGDFFGDLYPMSLDGYQNKSAITVEQILKQKFSGRRSCC